VTLHIACTESKKDNNLNFNDENNQQQIALKSNISDSESNTLMTYCVTFGFE
jgi:hypothetical protein